MDVDPLVEASLDVVLGHATFTRGIMEAVRSKPSKLNKEDIANIGANTERLTAIVGLLVARVATAEGKLAEAQRSTTSHPPPVHEDPTNTYAMKLKLERSQEARAVPVRQGPVVAVYPADDQRDALKTASETKQLLKATVHPAKIGVTINGIRPCGNGGVIIQTGSAKAAEALKKAIPPAEPKDRLPLISLSGAENTDKFEEVVGMLYEQNLQDSQWTASALQKDLKPLFRRQQAGLKKPHRENRAYIQIHV